jgi:hypothetical protein
VRKVLTKEYIENLGYEVEEISYRIFLVKNFLTDAESNKLVKIGRQSSDEEWSFHYMNGVREMALSKFGRTDLDNLVAEGLYEITHNWIDKTLPIKDDNLRISLDKRCQRLFDFVDDLQFKGCGTIQRQYDGVPLKDHVDNHTDPSLEYAVVFYLNDDYTNGEVFFVNQEIQMRPPKNSLLIFPTSEEWRHGVNAPGPGPHRYVIPGFVEVRDFWKKHEENGYNLEVTLSELKGD